MKPNTHKPDIQTLLLKVIPWLFITIGVALRFAEWIHHRDLMMDELNVARNIYERSFIDLFKPLFYEQFAPPLFLWAIKLSSITFGFGEMSLRLFPIICSSFSLFILYRICIESGFEKGAWYAISIFGWSEFYVQYGNDVKQYASDALISLSLILLTIRSFKQKQSPRAFFIYWSIIGSLAIWFSMPSVFMLAGVGIMLLITSFKTKQYTTLYALVGAGMIWLLMFAAYYFLLLRFQIGSDYLQNFHEHYFLKIHSLTDVGDIQNRNLINDLLYNTFGNRDQFYFYFNLIGLSAGFFFLFKKGVEYGLMVMIPVVALLVASALHLYTLLPRVCIFIMPVLLFISAAGIAGIIRLLKYVWLQIPIYIIGLTSIYASQQLKLFNVKNRIEVDELTTQVSFARSQNVAYNQIYLPALYNPCLIYYSTIHPDKQRRKEYQQIHVLKNEHYSQLRKSINGRCAFLYFWIDDNTIQQHRDSIFNYLRSVDSLIKPSYKVLVFEK